jgi:hypothetical protein
MGDFNTPVSVWLVLGRHMKSVALKTGEVGQSKVALRGGGVASGTASAKELDIREPSARISRRHVKDVVSHARHPGEDAEAWEVIGRRGKWLMIRAGEREGRGKDSRRRRTGYRRTWTTAGRG